MAGATPKNNNVPFRNAEELSRAYKSRASMADLPKAHQGPPHNLFQCGVGHSQGYPREPQNTRPRPFLTRCSIFDIDGKAEVVDRFFQWYSNFPYEVYPQRDLGGEGLCVVEVVSHGKGNVGTAHAGSIVHGGNQAVEEGGNPDVITPLYFVEDLTSEGAFESIHYERGRGLRTHKLELLNSTLLKCKDHGTSWEVNVLGQKQDKADKDDGGKIEKINEKMLDLSGRLLRQEIERELIRLEAKNESPEEQATKEDQSKGAALKQKLYSQV